MLLTCTLKKGNRQRIAKEQLISIFYKLAKLIHSSIAKGERLFK